MPRTLAQNAQYIAETIKPAIKSAIEAQGVTVPSTDSFLDYADRIGEIEGGGSGYQLKDLPSGAISTVNDAAELPLNALKVSVEAVQDLHGQSNPYPSGGGKNLLPMTVDGIKAINISSTWSGNTYVVNGVSFEVQTDDGGNVAGIKVNGTASSNIFFGVGNIQHGDIPNQFAVNGCPTGGQAYVTYNVSILNSSGGETIYTDTGNGVSGNASAFTANLRYLIRIQSGYSCQNLMFYPMLRTSGDSTFAPYSNICPIEGWDSGKISVVGKNWVKQVIQGYINTGNNIITIDNDAESVLFFARQGVKYTTSSQSTFDRNVLAQVDTDNVAQGTPVYNITNHSGYTWQAIWTGWTVWYIKASRDTVIEQTAQVEIGTTPTTYEPYQGKQYALNFPSTIYGAEWDVVGGSLKVTDGYIASYNGETLPSTWISDRDEYASGTTPTVGAEVVYKLATPTTIDLSPLSIRLLEGTNNLYADCGDVIEGEYFSGSAKGYVDGIKYANEGDGGIVSYTNIKSADELLGASAITFEVYARIDSYVSKTSGAYARLIEFGNSQQTGRLGFIGLASDNDNNLCYWDDTADVASGIEAWTLGDTHLISVVKTTSGGLKIYIDGVLKYTGSSTLTITSSIIDFVALRGIYAQPSNTGRQLNGEVYAWRVYAKEISAANIAQNLAADRSLYAR